MAKSEKLKAEMRAAKARRRAFQAADARAMARAAFVAASQARHNERVRGVQDLLHALEAEEEARMAAARVWRAAHTARNARIWGC